MQASELLSEIRQIVEEDWPTTRLPVLLSNLPRKLRSRVSDADYKEVLGGSSLKSFLRDNAELSGVQLVQDPAHSARVGVIPLGAEFEFPPLLTPTSGVSAADVQAFARVLGAMTASEQQAVAFPASFVSRLLSVR